MVMLQLVLLASSPRVGPVGTFLRLPDSTLAQVQAPSQEVHFPVAIPLLRQYVMVDPLLYSLV